eukprot:15357523-Alexandrium_andersonii.AAC.1
MAFNAITYGNVVEVAKTKAHEDIERLKRGAQRWWQACGNFWGDKHANVARSSAGVETCPSLRHKPR